VSRNLHLQRGKFASRLAESDLPLHQVRDARGHANVTMTSNYLRSRTDSLDDACAQLGRRRRQLKLVKGGPRMAHAINASSTNKRR
jgi:integrase